MKLTVFERINLLSVLPPQGNLVTLRISRELMNELSFSEIEIKQAGIKNLPNGKVEWNPVAAEGIVKDVEIGPVAKEIIIAELVKAEKAGKLKAQHLDLYEKFVIDQAPKKPKKDNE